MKYTTEKLREIIALECQKVETQKHILLQFYYSSEEDSEEVLIEKKKIIAAAINSKSWKRHYKERDGNFTVRVFDCKPLDDQLRAYVYTNLTDDEIDKIEIVGE